MTSSINKLSFVHIPKTAGLSLQAELENYFGKEKTIRIGNQEEREKFLSMKPEKLKSYDYISGHISVKELSQKGVHYPIISVLREPVKRLVSLQHYLTNSNLDQHRGVDFNNIDMLLEYMLSRGEFNMQCWHLCGTPSFKLATESIKTNNIFVIPLEYYQDLLDTLSDLLGISLKNRHINVTKYTNLIQSDDIKHELLDPLIGEDKKLYSYVKENYKNLKREFIQSLAR